MDLLYKSYKSFCRALVELGAELGARLPLSFVPQSSMAPRSCRAYNRYSSATIARERLQSRCMAYGGGCLQSYNAIFMIFVGVKILLYK